MLDMKTTITVEGAEYPMAFTVNVMETIQETYGTLTAWIETISPGKATEIKVKDVIWTFKEMVNEGIDIENEKTNSHRSFMTHKQAGRLITKYGLVETSNAIKQMIATSVPEAGEEKNAIPTQE